MTNQQLTPCLTRCSVKTAQEERDHLTLEALADVDANRVIDYPTIQVWAERLDTDEPLPIPFW